MTKMNTREMTAGNVLISKTLNEIKLNSNKGALKILFVHLLS